jgi:hypothetical protein
MATASQIAEAQAKLDAKNKPLVDKYASLGLTNASEYVYKNGAKKGLVDEEAAKVALVKNVYGLDPKDYLGRGKPGLEAATKLYQYNLPKIEKAASPGTFFDAVNNYSNALSQIQKLGIQNINEKDFAELQTRARQLRDFDSKNLGPNAAAIVQNSQLAIDKILQVRNQRAVVDQKTKSAKNTAEKKSLNTEKENLQRLIREGNQAAPLYIESLSRFNLSDINPNLEKTAAKATEVNTAIESLRAGGVVPTGGLAGRLNIKVTDQEILDDINAGTKAQYRSLYDTGTAAVADLQSQLSQANQFIASLPVGDSRKASAQKTADDLSSKLAQAQKDTLESKDLYDNYKPISGETATKAIANFRKTLELPEERTIAQIEAIDPTTGSTVRALADQYKKMAETPTGATTTAQTEELRSNLEQEALNQLKLGSTLGADELRQYQQAARAAQTARGNIFGVAPAVQEAVETGAAGEARKLARFGAASQFLSSGETTGAAQARDVGLRNALEQSRLGAAQQFLSSGPTVYNLANQRYGQQLDILGKLSTAATPQGTAGFTATPTANAGYQYVNPNAALQGAQNASNIYGTMADIYKTGTQYALGSQGQSGASTFAQYAGGIGNLLSPVMGAFKSYSLGGAV